MTKELTITHSFAEGTLIEGMTRGDGSYEIVTGVHGWRWFRSLDTCGVAMSRDRLSKTWAINAAATALRAAGFEVVIKIDDDPRPMAEREAALAERLEQRADRLAERATRRGAEAQTAGAAADRLAEALNGEPVKMDHYSAPRHLRDLDRMHTLTHKSIDLRKEAVRLAGAAESAAIHVQHRENPYVTARRLERLAAERRVVQRNLDGYERNFRNGRGEIYQVERHGPATGEWRERQLLVATDLDEQITYWTAHLEQAKAEGLYNPVDVAAIRKGDAIKHGGRWERVVRVNKTTVTVETPPGWDNKVKIVNITEHRPVAADDAPRSE